MIIVAKYRDGKVAGALRKSLTQGFILVPTVKYAHQFKNRKGANKVRATMEARSNNQLTYEVVNHDA